MNELYREYDNLMAGKESRFPKNFSGSEDVVEKTALSIIRYALDTYLRLPAKTLVNTADRTLYKMMHLDPLIKYVRVPPEYRKKRYQYVTRLLYDSKIGADLKTRTEYYYQNLLDGKVKRFPEEYFYGNDGIEKALICLRYAIKINFIKADPEFLYNLFASDSIHSLLKTWKLENVCKAIFKSPLSYLHLALPATEESDEMYEFYSQKMSEFAPQRKDGSL